VSLMAVAPLPLTPAYAISKAAAFNLTQSLRALLAARGVRVNAVLTGPTDTDMTRGFEIPWVAGRRCSSDSKTCSGQGVRRAPLTRGAN
jgi:NAD(P)-dependent dehydrogenase (short-subunit alcohol dehydrogenase family)